MKNYCLLLSIIYALISLNSVVPTPTGLNLSFLINTEKPCIQKSKQDLFLANAEILCGKRVKRQINGVNSVVGLNVYALKIRSNINNRFANTVVTTKVHNSATTAQKEILSVVVPNDAFVTDFVMEIGGQNYTSYVVDNEEARQQFDSALADGLGAGFVAPSARDSNVFIISINVEPNSDASFYLTYQELLKRTHGVYENVINIHPGQFVQNLSVEVSVEENKKLKNVKVPPLRSGNQIGTENLNLDPKAVIKSTSDSSAVITFSPNIETQQQFVRLLKTSENKGLAAQFVVQYDVEREPNGGEMLSKNCFFVNFFAPSDLKPISKHIVFVLDTSGSMSGNKINQLKTAMAKILDQLREKDLFNLVEFSNNAVVWNLDNSAKNVMYSEISNNVNYPNAYPGNSKYITAAKNSVNKFVATGGTSALSGLNLGLRLVEMSMQNKVDNIDRQEVIVFLTDGIPNKPPETIIKTITALNTGLKKSSIFSLSFGEDANQAFLQKLSLMNNGTAKHIYESSDSAKQLETFYDEISSPILLDVRLSYNPSQVTNVSRTRFPVLYQGSEIVVSGKCGASKVIDPPEISGSSSNGPIKMKPVVSNSLTDISRLWAYVTVKDLLDKKKTSTSDELDKQIADLSIKYSFVTGPSSMVVTSPHKDFVVGNQELEDTTGKKSHPKAIAPNPNYVRPTTTTTTTPKPTVTNANTKVFSSKMLINLSLICLFLSHFYK